VNVSRWSRASTQRSALRARIRMLEMDLSGAAVDLGRYSPGIQRFATEGAYAAIHSAKPQTLVSEMSIRSPPGARKPSTSMALPLEMSVQPIDCLGDLRYRLELGDIRIRADQTEPSIQVLVLVA